MQLRPYQKRVIDDIKNAFELHNRVVMSICPSGGKTLTASHYAVNSGVRTLILAHGTDVLRTQWSSRLKEYNIDHSIDVEENKNITVQLPQSLYQKEKLPNVDLLIIDEAHEFYFTNNKEQNSMIDKIIEKTNPNKILFLTGTPSKFIKNGYKTIVVSADELIEQDYISDVYFGLATTNEPLRRTDFKNDGNLKTNFNFRKTHNTLDNLINAIHQRLVGLNRFSPHIKNWDKITHKIFSQLDKTMIACNSIKQANQVYRYFKNKKINVITSHYLIDKNSENINAFIKNDDIKVLVVVDRGTLGFDMRDLVNVVDLTCSRNIDRIYQMYARVMRKSDKTDMKMYFKVVPENDIQLYKFYMQAALCMMRNDFISSYNGKNLDKMEIPVIKPQTKKKKYTKHKSKSKQKTPEKYYPVDKFFYENITVANLLSDIYNKQSRTLNEYAFTTIGKIREKNFGIQRPIVGITEENLKYMIETGEIDERIYNESLQASQ